MYKGLSWLQLRKFVSPELLFGAGSLELAGRYAKNFGATRVLVVTGKHLLQIGWPRKVMASLEGEGLEYSVFSDVTPNPRAEEVMRGAEYYEKEGCNVIVAVGGGSPTDCAKGIGIVSANKKHILEFEGADRVPKPGPPLICVPTTSGASADVSQFAIISDTRKKAKVTIVSKKVVPDVSLVDPNTTVTMSPKLTAHTGVDALTHGIESYVSNASSLITDMFALSGIGRISQHLIQAVREPENMEHRGMMMEGSMETGLAFSNASLGLMHAMSHSLGGFSDIPHGESNAILLPYVIEFNYDTVPERYDHIAEAIGLKPRGLDHREKKKLLFDGIKDILARAGINESLGELGLKKEDVPDLARKAMKDACIATNPRPVRLEDAIATFEKAL
jgi:alcohol dehydrogenase class IV